MLANQNAGQQHAGNPDITATGNGARWYAGKFRHHCHRIAHLHGQIWTPTYPSQHPNGIVICSATFARLTGVTDGQTDRPNDHTTPFVVITSAMMQRKKYLLCNLLLVFVV